MLQCLMATNLQQKHVKQGPGFMYCNIDLQIVHKEKNALWIVYFIAVVLLHIYIVRAQESKNILPIWDKAEIQSCLPPPPPSF